MHKKVSQLSQKQKMRKGGPTECNGFLQDSDKADRER